MGEGRTGYNIRVLRYILVAALSARSVSSFLFPKTLTRSSSVRAESSEDGSLIKNSEELFESIGWKSIAKDLNELPVFCCANEEGHPLAYSIEMGEGEKFTVPFFYCDVDDAKQELDKAKENTKVEGLDLIPFPLGKAFQMWAQDEAVIVPNQEALLQAGAPPNTNPIGQQVPLFACMEIMQENDKGEGVLPLFMSLDEANAAVKQAVEMDGGGAEQELEVVSLSLQRAIELLATVPDTPAFQFLAPQKSFDYIQKYLSEDK